MDDSMNYLTQLEPLNEENETLRSNVHPTDWRNPVPAGRYNLVVVGAGTAGLVTAAGAAGLGAKVALVERGLMGGDCLNVGCVPSKPIISAARRAAAVRDSTEFGVNCENLQVDS
jgi:ribulose 1,5-bisphosphate synthetase/thiazole synthase